MNNGPLKSMLLFLASRYNQIIIILAILGILLSLQGKQPLYMSDHNPRFVVEEEMAHSQQVRIKPPIHHYQGLIQVQVDHAKAKNNLSIAASSGNRYITTVRVAPGSEGSCSFLIYPGKYKPESGLTLLLTNREGLRPAQVIKAVTFSFPKTGNWLVPDFFLWTFLLLMVIFFGLICSLVWKAQINVHASFAATVFALLVVINFGGLEIAQRIGDQLFAVIFLFIIVLLFRSFLSKPQRVEIQD